MPALPQDRPHAAARTPAPVSNLGVLGREGIEVVDAEGAEVLEDVREVQHALRVLRLRLPPPRTPISPPRTSQALHPAAAAACGGRGRTLPLRRASSHAASSLAPRRPEPGSAWGAVRHHSSRTWSSCASSVGLSRSSSSRMNRFRPLHGNLHRTAVMPFASSPFRVPRKSTHFERPQPTHKARPVGAHLEAPM